MRAIIANVFMLAGVHAFGQIWSSNSVPGVLVWGGVAISADGSKVIAYGGSDGIASIYISTNAGATWVSNNLAPSEVSSVACSPDGTAFAVVTGSPSVVWLSTNTGTTWNQLDYFAQYVVFTPDGKKLILLDNYSGSELVITTNWGATWSVTPLPGAPDSITGPLAVSSDGTTMVAGGEGGIYTSTNSGQSWVESMPASDGTWNTVTCSDDGSRMAAAANPGNVGIVVTTNSGTTWSRTSNGGAPQWDIASSADGTRLIATPDLARIPGLYVSSDSGFTWTLVMSGGYGAVACSQDGTHLVAFSESSIFIGLWPPSITIGVTNANIVLSWPAPSAGFVLQQNTDPATTNWTAVPITPLVTNYQNQVTVPVSNGTLFYRLRD